MLRLLCNYVFLGRHLLGLFVFLFHSLAEKFKLLSLRICFIIDLLKHLLFRVVIRRLVVSDLELARLVRVLLFGKQVLLGCQLELDRCDESFLDLLE